MSRITIEWSDEDHVFIAEVNGQKTHGDTRAEALKNAEEVLLMLEENATDAELLAEARALLSDYGVSLSPEALICSLAGILGVQR